jgi:hypothetical protein
MNKKRGGFRSTLKRNQGEKYKLVDDYEKMEV